MPFKIQLLRWRGLGFHWQVWLHVSVLPFKIQLLRWIGLGFHWQVWLHVSVLPFKIQLLRWRELGFHWHLCTFPKPGSGSPLSYVVFLDLDLFVFKDSVSVSYHYKGPIKHIGLLQGAYHHHFIECDLFLQWYSWTIDCMFGVKQQSLT